MASVRMFDICVARPKTNDSRDGVWWLRIGRASENEKGQISLFVDAIPFDWKGQAMLFEQRERDERTSTRSRTPSSEDDIPL